MAEGSAWVVYKTVPYATKVGACCVRVIKTLLGGQLACLSWADAPLCKVINQTPSFGSSESSGLVFIK